MTKTTMDKSCQTYYEVCLEDWIGDLFIPFLESLYKIGFKADKKIAQCFRMIAAKGVYMKIVSENRQ